MTISGRGCRKENKGLVFQRPLAGSCPVCDTTGAINPASDACICPPLGEPENLTIVAPAVFDECGINLCKVIELPECILQQDNLDSIELKVIDIDFNIHPGGSSVQTLTRRPNCVRVHLTDIVVKFAARLLDRNCRVLDEICFEEKYLPSNENDPSFDELTNPVSISVELYTPYGVSYSEFGSCCKPTINFLGFIAKDGRNNALRQGVGAQALAKVVNLDLEDGLAAVGLTIYFKVIYFVQYKIPHRGLCVPPKCLPAEEAASACVEFVEGDLLEQSIQPLELCCKPKTIRSGRRQTVTDPTPANPCD
ncbi:MAG: hypothetical protein GX238_07705 [Epulopiscium sp.]|nr:hypothetical protein [Candidatus Epulonipiscium sp.]